MAFNLADRVKETTTTAGTGAITLGGAPGGYQTFASGISVGDTTWYAIAGAAEFEVGIGTLTDATTLSRDSVFSSSNGNAKVSFGAGVKEVFITAPASALKAITKPAKVEVFTANGTWTKDPAAKRVRVILRGGDGGGGSGARRPAGTPAIGGPGGAGAGYSSSDFLPESLPSSVPIQVGAAGLGGAAVTTNNTPGNPGTSGGISTFGATTDAWYVAGYPGGGGGLTGATVGGTNSAQLGLNTDVSSIQGAGSSATGSSGSSATSSNKAAGAGGSGATQGTTAANFNGGAGSPSGGLLFNNFPATGGAASSKTPASRTTPSPTINYGFSGHGGGGGYSASDGTAGGGYSMQGNERGGGGGGGGSVDGNPSGAGGNGGAGLVVIEQYF